MGIVGGPVDDRAISDGGWIDIALDEAILRCDHAGRIVDARGSTEALPVDRDALTGRRIADIAALPAAMRQSWTMAVERCLDTQRPQISAYTLIRDGSPRAFEARMLPLAGGMAVIAVRDVGERNLLRERVEYLAMHDVVTGLGNIRALRERLASWLPRDGDVRAVGAAAAPVALFIVDLDRFKQNNDLHGRSIGDSLLRLAAQRMEREAVLQWRDRPYDAQAAATPTRADDLDDPLAAASISVVRLGGDQFAIAWRIDVGLEAPSATDRATALAARLIAALGAPTRIAGQTLFVRASIGIALFPDDGRDSSSLFSNAEAALKRAKLAGRNQFRRHGDDTNGAGARGPTLPPNTEASMRDALAARQFLLVYQPKFELASSLAAADADPDGHRHGPLAPGAVIAVEALCRWRTPSGALLVPQDFIPLAESSGIIRPLGDWVLRQALSEVASFAARDAEVGRHPVGVSVNVSLSQLHDRLFVEVVRAALRDHGFEAHELTLEIAETAFVEDIRLVADVVAELSALGVRFAIDHFGAGTGGLVALKALPIDEIKIDRSFIAGAAIDAFDATIVAGLIAMAHDLGKTVTAEGVERFEQIAALAKLRCDAIQGYFIGEPMTADELFAAMALWRKKSVTSRP